MPEYSRVAADIYRGVELPADWATHASPIGLGNARDLIFSVVALLDAQDRPLALCWQAGGTGEDHFVRARFDDAGDGDLDTALTRDLVAESERIGIPDLLATLLWAPDELTPGQGIRLQERPRRTGPYQLDYFDGWNVAPRNIAARAADILLIVRRCDDGLQGELPSSAARMRAEVTQGDADTWVVLPSHPGDQPEPARIHPLQALLIGLVLLLAIAAVSAVVAGG